MYKPTKLDEYIVTLRETAKSLNEAFPTTIVAPKECTTRYLTKLWLTGVKNDR